MKPKFSVDIAKEAASCLDAHIALHLLTEEGCWHIANGLRHPLGIYNVSVARVCDKVVRLCSRLEDYFRASKTIDSTPEIDNVMEAVIDYVELTLYAAAEHVDDIDSIASGFFPNNAIRDKTPTYKNLQKEVKKHKRLIASVANAIKHQQSRIRMFSMEFAHAGEFGCLHGYFVEGVDNGVVGPSKTFHTHQEVFSLSTLIWEVLIFLLNCSRELAQFLNTVAVQTYGPVNAKSEQFSKAIVAATRLPNYSFGEEHPFARVTLSLFSSDPETVFSDSQLYGSLMKRWATSNEAKFGPSTSRFSGDGTTRTFRFVQPKSIAFQHWT